MTGATTAAGAGRAASLRTDEELMAEAERRTGLRDWGEHDGFRVGLRVLLATLDDLDLAPKQRQPLVETWLARLGDRLRLIDHANHNPAIAQEPIAGPVVVIGLPRSGTTVLVDLLALDPAARAPLQWETALPWPPPSRQGWASDPRVSEAGDRAAAHARANPELAALHSSGPTLPDECNAILGIEFWSPNFWASRPLPRYERWLARSRIDRPYWTHHRVLQHLQHHGPIGRWTLKSPFHQFDLPALLAQYPDAMLIQTHRDPVAITASNASLICAVRRLPPGHPDRAEVGRSNLALWGEGLRRGMAAREDPTLDARVFDLSNRDLNADPVGSLRSVYDYFGLPFTDEFAARIRSWAQHPTQPPSGRTVSLSDVGLDRAMVEEAYAAYRSRFGRYFD